MAQSNTQFRVLPIPAFFSIEYKTDFSVKDSAKLFFAMSKGAGIFPASFFTNLIKNNMKNFILFLALFAFLATGTKSNAQPYYYNSGIPTLFQNWGNQPGGTGTAPSSFGENTEYIIESGKTAVLDFQWFIDNNATLRINSGGMLQVNHTLNMGAGTTLRLDSAATLIYNSTTIAWSTIFGGTEIFRRHSNFKINNWSGLTHAITDSLNANSADYYTSHYFGNLELNWQSCNGNWFLINKKFFDDMCSDDFRVTSTGTGKAVLCIKDTNNYRNIYARDYIQTGGEVDFSYSSTASTYSVDMRLFGSFTKTGGILDATDDLAKGIIYFNANFGTTTDTSLRTFYNSGTLRNLRISINDVNFKLLSNLDFPNPHPLVTLYLASSTIDFGEYKITGTAYSTIANCLLKISSAEGFKNGASGGNMPLAGERYIFYGNTLEYCGQTAQIMGDSLPYHSPYINYVINNSNGVTLSKDIRLDTNNSIKFISGKLNLGNNNLKIDTPDSVIGVNQNSFINTNGTGYLRIGLNGGYNAKYPVGNGTFSPFYITQAYGGNNDTIGIRVENGFGSHSPFDTSRCVRKIWRVLDEVPSNGTYFRVAVQFMKSDAGINMDYASPCAVGQYEPGYNGYFPRGANIYEQFYSPPDSTVSKAIYSTSFSTTGDDYFVAGNETGVYETYFPDNSGDASQLGNWSSLNGGLHPPSFDRYAIFSVPNGQTASFNSITVFSDKAYLRGSGNGIINANASVTVNGWLELKDSSTYNHNNTGVASQTCFAGREFITRNTNFNILKWSDTTDKIFDEMDGTYGNLTINFNNLPEPFGSNNYWTVFKNISPYHTYAYIQGNLKYLQSSGYQFAPIGYGNNLTDFTVYGNVQIGDSLNLTANPQMNLSGGTTRAANMSAGTLYICGNLDIQNGGLTSQFFPAVARGNVSFKREVFNVPQSHTFYSYAPFNWQTSNLGTAAFPNKIESDTLTLKSDMYNSGNAAFLFTDAWQVESGAVLNMDVYRIRSLNLTIKDGGKLITKNIDGFNIDAASQTVTFEPSAILEFAGSTPQNFQKAGGYNLTSFPNVTINNPAGVTVNTAGVSITNSLNFISGKVTSDNINYLTFPGTVVFNGASNNSFLNGPVKINTNATSTITIPTGKGSVIRSVGITPTSSSSTDWMVEYFNQQQTFGSTLGAGLTSISTAEYYLINRNGTADARVGLYWGSNSGVTNPVNLRVARWNDFQWEDKGNYSYSGDNTGGVIFSNVVTNFSPFAIASTDNQQLPVELSSFNSSSDKNNVTLSWTTESEVNNSGYDVERKSLSDTTWKKISFVQSAGNSHSAKTYKYEDRNLATGIYKYRLKQIDFNGNYKYYNLQNEINVGVPFKFNLSQNYPNPFNPATKINYDLPFDSKVSIKLFDITGREVALIVNSPQTAGYYTVEFNGSNLASGTYFYNIIAEGGNTKFVTTKKMMLLK
jgi:hypothetical protein